MLMSAQVRAEFAELGFVQLRAGFAENTVLRAGSWAKCLGRVKAVLCEISLVDAQARAKPCYASALHAWVRAGPRRICRENRAPC